MPPFQVLLCKELPLLFEARELLNENPHLLYMKLDALIHTMNPESKEAEKLLPMLQKITVELTQLSNATYRKTGDELSARRNAISEEQRYLRNSIAGLYDEFIRVMWVLHYMEVGHGITPRKSTIF